MARVTKEHEERKNELLDAAQELFNALGYDATSVNAIIEKVGVSKGTFYYYFDSKEEILDCVAARVADRVLDRVRNATDEEMDAITKLNTFFAVAGRWKAANRAVILMLVKALYGERNVLLREKITRRMVGVCAPVIAAIIEQGVREGVLDVPDPDDAAELVFQLSVAFRDVTAELLLHMDERPDAWRLIERKLRSFENAVERMLGAPKGSFQLADDETLQAFRNGGNARAQGVEEDAARAEESASARATSPPQQGGAS